MQDLDYTQLYVFQVRAEDALGDASSAEYPVRSVPVFDWGESDFRFNVPVSVQGKPLTDFITEQGTSGQWTYRKYRSGTVELWARVSWAGAVSNAWGSLFVSGQLSTTDLAYPFELAELPMVTVTLSPNGHGSFVMASGGSRADTESTGCYEIVRGTAANGTFILNYHVIGKVVESDG